MSAPTASPNDCPETADAAPDSQSCKHLPQDSLADAWAAIATRWDELCEYAAFYLAAHVDQVRLTSRTTAMWAILGAVVALIAVSSVATASVLVVLGASAGVGQLLGGRYWLGQLLVGGGVISLTSGGIWLFLFWRVRAYRQALVKKYELRKQAERSRYGTDVAQRAEQLSKDS
jgi:hypothetical protein